MKFLSKGSMNSCFSSRGGPGPCRLTFHLLGGIACLILTVATPAEAGELRITTYGPEIPLFSEVGEMYLGDPRFEMSEDGEVSPVLLRQRMELLHTDNRDFFIRGEVYLGGTYRQMRYPEDFLSGFTIFVRETGPEHRYELNPVRLRTKRRLQEGEKVNGINHPVLFDEPSLNEWVSFSALVTADRIVFQIGDQTGRIPGPLDADGKTLLGLAPGSKLRNVWLSFVEGVEEPERPQPWTLPNLRTWTDVDGRTMHAELIAWDDASVTVRRSYDGRVFTIPLEILSEEDREFIARLSASAPIHISAFLWATASDGSAFASAHGVAVDRHGNTYVAGDFRDEVRFGDTVLNSRGGSDVFLAKYDSNGELLWARQEGGSGPTRPGSSGDVAFDVAVDDEGNVFIAGYFHGTATFGETELTGRGGNEIFVAKYSGEGDLLWVRHAGGSQSDTAQTIAAAGSGVAIGGFFRGESVFGDHTLRAAPSAGDSRADAYVARLDGDGNFLWVAAGSGIGSNVSYDMAFDRDGNIFVCGYLQETATFARRALVSAGDNDVFVAKYDPNGELLWIRQGGGTGTDIARAIHAGLDGNAYVLGTFEGTATFGHLSLTSQGGLDFFLAKYDSEGDLLWLAQGAGGEEIIGSDLVVDGQGNVFVAGTFRDTISFGEETLTSHGDEDVFVAQYDRDGKFVWAKRAGGEDVTRGNAIALDERGDLYIAGMVRSSTAFGRTTLDGKGDGDAFLARLRLSLRLAESRPAPPDVRIRISGEVREPGRIEYYSPPSLARVLEDAGGLTPLANRVYILRSNGNELELINLSRRDVQNSEITGSLLQDCDWIHASSPHLDPWPKEWPRQSTSDPSGLDSTDQSRLTETWCEPKR